MAKTLVKHGFIRSGLILAVAFALGCSGRVPAAPPVTTIESLRSLLGTPAARDRVVELLGFLTFVDRDRRVLYLQDRTGAMAFDVGNLEGLSGAREFVRLTGTLEANTGIPPRLRGLQLTVVGQSRLEWTLDPRPVRGEALVARRAEAEWVEIHAQVKTSTVRGSSLVLEMQDEGTTFRAFILDHDPYYPDLVGSRLRLRGVNAVRMRSGETSPADLLIPSEASVRIVGEPPPARSRTPPLSAGGLPVLTTAAEVRELSRDEAKKAYPILLRAIVTYSNPDTNALFVQDHTSGIYVEAWRYIHRVKPGDEVELSGVTWQGDFAPIVGEPRLRVLGHRPLPKAPLIAPEEFVTGRHDSQWVELEGVIRSIRHDRFVTRLVLVSGNFRISVATPGFIGPAVAKGLVGARARIAGVGRTVMTRDRQLAGVAHQLPDLRFVRVMTPPPAAALTEIVRPVSSVLQFTPGHEWQHRVRVQGTVTYSQPGELYLVDDTGGMRVQTLDEDTPAVGDDVDVTGFAVADEYRPRLEDAEVSRRGRGAPPPPKVVSAEAALGGRFDASLVTIEARIVESVGGRDEQRILLRSGPHVFAALLRGRGFPVPPVGSDVRLTGVCAVEASEQHLPQAFRILLRSPEDMVVLRTPPWWNAERAAYILAALIGVIVAFLAWVSALRRRVAAQSALIWQRVKRETELQERQRMARELHDTLEQDLAGIGLSLEAAAQALPGSPKAAERHVALALEQLSAGIEDVRYSVWSLRDPSFDPDDLAGALGELGRQLAKCSARPIAIDVKIHGARSPLPPGVEDDLLRIGQEALTNAVRHGNANRITVALKYEPETFHLIVRDDGRGFDTTAAVPPGHFGLVGMRERAQVIGARLEVHSRAGEGTQVDVLMPLRRVALSQAG
jgi:signal transduction histidine kinase